MEQNTEYVPVPCNQVPSIRAALSIQAGNRKRWLIKGWGGLGDQVCAEPTIRFMANLPDEYEVTLLTEFPDLYTHIPNLRIITSTCSLESKHYYTVPTIETQDKIVNLFITHAYIQPVDYVSINLLRGQLPVADRQIHLPDFESDFDIFRDLKKSPEEFILVHPGKHWESKTFPAEYWKEVTTLLAAKYHVILIGQKIDQNIGYVEFDAPGNSTDLRGHCEFQLTDFVAFCKNSKRVLTNDSSPIHLSASGDAEIFYFATAKASDYLLHWRHGVLGWAMHDLALGSVCGHIPSPILSGEGQTILFDKCSEERMRSLLPNPRVVYETICRGLK